MSSRFSRASIRWSSAWATPTKRRITASAPWSFLVGTNTLDGHGVSNMPGSCGSTCVAASASRTRRMGQPHANSPEQQVGFLLDAGAHADFYLTQIVSHHQAHQVEAFLDEARRRASTLPAVFGVFYYRSAESRDAQDSATVSAGAGRTLAAEFAAGATPVDVCARTIRTLLISGRGTFMSVTCRSAARRRPQRDSGEGRGQTTSTVR